MRMKRVVVMFVCVHLTLMLACQASLGQQTRPADDGGAGELRVEDIRRGGVLWREIKRVTPDTSREGLSEREYRYFWWDDLIVSMNRDFWRLASEPRLEEKLRWFVGRFGEEGPAADLRWLLAAPGITLIVQGDERDTPMLPFEPEPEMSEAQRQRIREQIAFSKKVLMTVCEAQVRQWLREPAKLDRYYRAVMWSREWLPEEPMTHWINLQSLIRVVHHGFTERPEEEYWFYARHALLLGHLTSRQDLFKGAKPDEVDERFMQWYEWISTPRRFVPNEDAFAWEARQWTTQERREKAKKYKGKPWEWMQGADEPLGGLEYPDTPFANWNEQTMPEAPGLLPAGPAFRSMLNGLSEPYYRAYRRASDRQNVQN